MNTAIEASKQLCELHTRILLVKDYTKRKDLQKYLRNMDTLVNEMSNREVDARRTGNYIRVDTVREQLKTRKKELEKLILMALLMQ